MREYLEVGRQLERGREVRGYLEVERRVERRAGSEGIPGGPADRR